MAADRRLDRYDRRKEAGRRSGGPSALLYTTAGCSINEPDFMYNDSEDILILSGLDPERMEYLPAAERRRLLMDAGLDPREFDF